MLPAKLNPESDGAAEDGERPKSVAELTTAALDEAQREHKRVIATTNLMQQLTATTAGSARLSAMGKADWTALDIGFESVVGERRLYNVLRNALVAVPAYSIYFSTGTSQMAAIQQPVLDKLLEYTPQAPVAAGQPRTANELLHWMAMELSAATFGNNGLPEFVLALIKLLHSRGFNIDSRDAQGRTLLTQYAARGEATDAIVQELLRLGASAFATSTDGRSLLHVWVQINRPSLVHDALTGKAPWGALGIEVEPWLRNAEGRTLVEAAQAMEANWADVAELLLNVELLWQAKERPLLVRSIAALTPLIPDLAQLVLGFVDGAKRKSDAN